MSVTESQLEWTRASVMIKTAVEKWKQKAKMYGHMSPIPFPAVHQIELCLAVSQLLQQIWDSQIWSIFIKLIPEKYDWNECWLSSDTETLESFTLFYINAENVSLARTETAFFWDTRILISLLVITTAVLVQFVCVFVKVFTQTSNFMQLN